MTTPNPLIPQGSLLEQKAKGKPHLRIAYIIVGVHLLFLGGLLIQGCSREDPPDGQTAASGGISTNDSGLPPLDGGSLYSTNLPAPDAATVATLVQPAPIPPSTNLPTQQLHTPAPAEPSASAQEYTVAKGDSFYTIGKKFGVSTREIAKANPTIDPNRLQIGQKLVIPAPMPATVGSPATTTTVSGEVTSNTYTVKSGDTLTKIAQAHGTTVGEIRTLNGLRTDRINVNQKLKLPPPRAAASTTTTATAVTASLPLQSNP
jgi:LysM repeat protein